MKPNRLLLLAVSVLVLGLFSCKKDKDKDEAPTPQVLQIEGKNYPIVTIGNQVWMAANYSGSTGVYYNNDANNAESGKFYTKEEAKALIPPTGWRLPSHQDYITLFTSKGVEFTVNGNGAHSTMSNELRPFMSINGWIGGVGTNTTGLNAYPTGMYEEEFTGKGGNFSFWTSTELPDQRYYFGIYNTADQPYAYYGPIGGTVKFSVRFVKDK